MNQIPIMKQDACNAASAELTKKFLAVYPQAAVRPSPRIARGR